MILFVSSKQTTMKRLFNVSPFILLLAPVFVMSMIFAILANQATDDKSEFTLKTRSAPLSTLIMNQLKK